MFDRIKNWLFVLLALFFGFEANAQDASTTPFGSYLSPVSNRPLFSRGLKLLNDGTLRFRDDSVYVYGSGADSLTIKAGTILFNTGNSFWGSQPFSVDPSQYFSYFEDFIAVDLDSSNGALAGATSKAQSATDATLSGWRGAGDTPWTITSAAGTLGGIVTFTAKTGSNNEVYHQLGELGTETFVEYTASSAKRSWIEFRLNPNAVDDAGNLVFGLAEEGSAAADFIADAGNDIADKDFVGFIQYEGNPDTLLLAYQTAGGATGFADSVLITATIATYGIYFDGATTLSWWINGTQVGSKAISASLFPDTEELAPFIGIKQGAADRTAVVDWIKIVNER